MTGARAAAVLRALGPDNVGFPPGLTMRMAEEAGGLVLEFESRGAEASLAPTVDEALGHAQVALGVTGQC